MLSEDEIKEALIRQREKEYNSRMYLVLSKNMLLDASFFIRV